MDVNQTVNTPSSSDITEIKAETRSRVRAQHQTIGLGRLFKLKSKDRDVVDGIRPLGSKNREVTVLPAIHEEAKIESLSESRSPSSSCSPDNTSKRFQCISRVSSRPRLTSISEESFITKSSTCELGELKIEEGAWILKESLSSTRYPSRLTQSNFPSKALLEQHQGDSYIAVEEGEQQNHVVSQSAGGEGLLNNGDKMSRDIQSIDNNTFNSDIEMNNNGKPSEDNNPLNSSDNDPPNSQSSCSKQVTHRSTTDPKILEANKTKQQPLVDDDNVGNELLNENKHPYALNDSSTDQSLNLHEVTPRSNEVTTLVVGEDNSLMEYVAQKIEEAKSKVGNNDGVVLLSDVIQAVNDDEKPGVTVTGVDFGMNPNTDPILSGVEPNTVSVEDSSMEEIVCYLGEEQVLPLNAISCETPGPEPTTALDECKPIACMAGLNIFISHVVLTCLCEVIVQLAVTGSKYTNGNEEHSAKDDTNNLEETIKIQPTCRPRNSGSDSLLSEVGIMPSPRESRSEQAIILLSEESEERGVREKETNKKAGEKECHKSRLRERESNRTKREREGKNTARERKIALKNATGDMNAFGNAHINGKPLDWSSEIKGYDVKSTCRLEFQTSITDSDDDPNSFRCSESISEDSQNMDDSEINAQFEKEPEHGQVLSNSRFGKRTSLSRLRYATRNFISTVSTVDDDLVLEKDMQIEGTDLENETKNSAENIHQQSGDAQSKDEKEHSPPFGTLEDVDKTKGTKEEGFGDFVMVYKNQVSEAPTANLKQILVPETEAKNASCNHPPELVVDELVTSMPIVYPNLTTSPLVSETELAYPSTTHSTTVSLTQMDSQLLSTHTNDDTAEVNELETQRVHSDENEKTDNTTILINIKDINPCSDSNEPKTISPDTKVEDPSKNHTMEGVGRFESDIRTSLYIESGCGECIISDVGNEETGIKSSEFEKLIENELKHISMDDQQVDNSYKDTCASPVECYFYADDIGHLPLTESVMSVNNIEDEQIGLHFGSYEYKNNNVEVVENSSITDTLSSPVEIYICDNTPPQIFSSDLVESLPRIEDLTGTKTHLFPIDVYSNDDKEDIRSCEFENDFEREFKLMDKENKHVDNISDETRASPVDSYLYADDMGPSPLKESFLGVNNAEDLQIRFHIRSLEYDNNEAEITEISSMTDIEPFHVTESPLSVNDTELAQIKLHIGSFESRNDTVKVVKGSSITDTLSSPVDIYVFHNNSSEISSADGDSGKQTTKSSPITEDSTGTKTHSPPINVHFSGGNVEIPSITPECENKRVIEISTTTNTFSAHVKETGKEIYSQEENTDVIRHCSEDIQRLETRLTEMSKDYRGETLCRSPIEPYIYSDDFLPCIPTESLESVNEMKDILLEDILTDSNTIKDRTELHLHTTVSTPIEMYYESDNIIEYQYKCICKNDDIFLNESDQNILEETTASPIDVYTHVVNWYKPTIDTSICNEAEVKDIIDPTENVIKARTELPLIASNISQSERENNFANVATEEQSDTNSKYFLPIAQNDYEDILQETRPDGGIIARTEGDYGILGAYSSRQTQECGLDNGYSITSEYNNVSGVSVEVNEEKKSLSDRFNNRHDYIVTSNNKQDLTDLALIDEDNINLPINTKQQENDISLIVWKEEILSSCDGTFVESDTDTIGNATKLLHDDKMITGLGENTIGQTSVTGSLPEKVFLNPPDIGDKDLSLPFTPESYQQCDDETFLVKPFLENDTKSEEWKSEGIKENIDVSTFSLLTESNHPETTDNKEYVTRDESEERPDIAIKGLESLDDFEEDDYSDYEIIHAEVIDTADGPCFTLHTQRPNESDDSKMWHKGAREETDATLGTTDLSNENDNDTGDIRSAGEISEQAICDTTISEHGIPKLIDENIDENIRDLLNETIDCIHKNHMVPEPEKEVKDRCNTPVEVTHITESGFQALEDGKLKNTHFGEEDVAASTDEELQFSKECEGFNHFKDLETRDTNEFSPSPTLMTKDAIHEVQATLLTSEQWGEFGYWDREVEGAAAINYSEMPSNLPHSRPNACESPLLDKNEPYIDMNCIHEGVDHFELQENMDCHQMHRDKSDNVILSLQSPRIKTSHEQNSLLETKSTLTEDSSTRPSTLDVPKPDYGGARPKVRTSETVKSKSHKSRKHGLFTNDISEISPDLHLEASFLDDLECKVQENKERNQEIEAALSLIPQNEPYVTDAASWVRNSVASLAINADDNDGENKLDVTGRSSNPFITESVRSISDYTSEDDPGVIGDDERGEDDDIEYEGVFEKQPSFVNLRPTRSSPAPTRIRNIKVVDIDNFPKDKTCVYYPDRVAKNESSTPNVGLKAAISTEAWLGPTVAQEIDPRKSGIWRKVKKCLHPQGLHQKYSLPQHMKTKDPLQVPEAKTNKPCTTPAKRDDQSRVPITWHGNKPSPRPVRLRLKSTTKRGRFVTRLKMLRRSTESINGPTPPFKRHRTGRGGNPTRPIYQPPSVQTPAAIGKRKRKLEISENVMSEPNDHGESIKPPCNPNPEVFEICCEENNKEKSLPGTMRTPTGTLKRNSSASKEVLRNDSNHQKSSKRNWSCRLM